MVLVVLLGGVVWMGTATAPAAQATKWIRLGVPFTLQLPSTVMIIVCAVRDELRDNHHVRRRTSVDPEGCLNRSKPVKCAGRGGAFIASGRRGRGFESRHPDSKAPGQRRFMIES
jgi:hypothetical protein